MLYGCGWIWPEVSRGDPAATWCRNFGYRADRAQSTAPRGTVSACRERARKRGTSKPTAIPDSTPKALAVASAISGVRPGENAAGVRLRHPGESSTGRLECHAGVRK